MQNYLESYFRVYSIDSRDAYYIPTEEGNKLVRSNKGW